MPTTVVNLRREPYDVYIGRAGRGQDGYFGNPHPVGEMCRGCTAEHNAYGRPGRIIHQRGEAVTAYRTDFYMRLETDPEFKRRVLELKGKRLGCFCKPAACHGDVIVEYLEGVA